MSRNIKIIIAFLMISASGIVLLSADRQSHNKEEVAFNNTSIDPKIKEIQLQNGTSLNLTNSSESESSTTTVNISNWSYTASGSTTSSVEIHRKNNEFTYTMFSCSGSKEECEELRNRLLSNESLESLDKLLNKSRK